MWYLGRISYHRIIPCGLVYFSAFFLKFKMSLLSSCVTSLSYRATCEVMKFCGPFALSSSALHSGVVAGSYDCAFEMILATLPIAVANQSCCKVILCRLNVVARNVLHDGVPESPMIPAAAIQFRSSKLVTVLPRSYAIFAVAYAAGFFLGQRICGLRRSIWFVVMSSVML